MMKLERTDTKDMPREEIPIKRMYLPYILKGKCPACGEDFERDFNDEYLSHPLFGKQQIDMYHESKNGDYCEFAVGINVDFILELVE